MKNYLYFILGFVIVMAAELSYCAVYEYPSDSPCTIYERRGQYNGIYSSVTLWNGVQVAETNGNVLITGSGTYASRQNVPYYNYEYKVSWYNGTTWSNSSVVNIKSMEVPEGFTDIGGWTAVWTSTVGLQCSPPCTAEKATFTNECEASGGIVDFSTYDLETCTGGKCLCDGEAAYNAALAECNGDIEAVQTINIDTCQYECSPCIFEPNTTSSSIPPTYYGYNYSEIVAVCGGPQKVQSYNSDTCVGTCQDENCETQYLDLVKKCGGENNIASFDNENCTGTCKPCAAETKLAIAECGSGGYEIDAQCGYECKKCPELAAACTAACGGISYVIGFSCEDNADGTSTLKVPCQCEDSPTVPIPDPGDLPSEKDVKTKVTTNPDGSSTRETVTYTKDTDGNWKQETVKTYYNPDGLQTGQETSVEQGTIGNDPNSPTTEEEEAEEENYEPLQSEKPVLTLQPMVDAVNAIGEKFPISAIKNAKEVVSQLIATGEAPSFTLNFPGVNTEIQISLDIFDPIAEWCRLLFKIALVLGVCLMIIKQWSN